LGKKSTTVLDAIAAATGVPVPLMTQLEPPAEPLTYSVIVQFLLAPGAAVAMKSFAGFPNRA
jgi:hypothetical protein